MYLKYISDSGSVLIMFAAVRVAIRARESVQVHVHVVTNARNK